MTKNLPIGSIVLLKKGNKKLMVFGRFQINANTKEMFDYVACFYPEGNVSPDYTFLFNHDDIEEIIFEGYTDEDEEKYIDFVVQELQK